MSNMKFSGKNVNDNSYIVPAERIENCFLASVKIGKPEKEGDKHSLIFNFEQRASDDPSSELISTFSYREFDPSEKPTAFPISDEDHQKLIDMAISRLVHIVGAYITSETAKEIEGDGWLGYITALGNALKGKYQGVVTALKVVYNPKGYPTFPKVPDFISTSIKPKQFTTNPQYDKYEKPGSNSKPNAMGGGQTMMNPAAGGAVDEDEAF